MNDQNSLRARESKKDAYVVFASMLDSGNPPSRWDDLLEVSTSLA